MNHNAEIVNKGHSPLNEQMKNREFFYNSLSSNYPNTGCKVNSNQARCKTTFNFLSARKVKIGLK